MFKFLKEKLKSAILKISEGVEKEGKVEEKTAEEPQKGESNASEQSNAKARLSLAYLPETRSQVTGFFAKLKEKFTGKEEEKEVIEQKKAEIEEKKEKIEIKKEENPIVIEHKKIEFQKIKEKIKHPIKEERIEHKPKTE
ncbi:MAG: hypothetical protein AABX78_01655, partial [Nanoarchaeota archaeon]